MTQQSLKVRCQPGPEGNALSYLIISLPCYGLEVVEDAALLLDRICFYIGLLHYTALF